MRVVVFLLGCVVVAGCAANADATSPEDVEGTSVARTRPTRRSPPPATATSPYGGPGCPETHAEAKKLHASCAEPPYRCLYPEGMCLCNSPQQCGGAERPPLPPLWECDPPPTEPCPPYP